MSALDRLERRELPIGRRVAQLRVRRGMSQQVFADRIGKSKSWVDKVERGVRNLDRLSVINTIAGVLGVAPDLLVGRRTRQATVTEIAAAVERVREALVRYDTPATCGADLGRQVAYAYTAYQHAQHPQVLRMLPDLLAAARHTEAADGPTSPADLLVRVYRLAAQIMVKLGEPDLAWLAADRAMTIAGGDPQRTAIAVVPLAQALRAQRRGRLALTVTTTALRHLDPAPSPDAPPVHVALAGTLMVEAALAAASYGGANTNGNLADQAARLAKQCHDSDGFGPTTVDLARALAATTLGDHALAVAIHLTATRSDDWHRLPAEHRAAHLIDMSRAYLAIGDHHAAARALVTADHIAPAETRIRPAARAALTAVLRAGPTPADLTRLATHIDLTRQP
ncbi:transcriptional regulator [Micromonospora qiuiae]|uniref:Transcriptional regulator n=1 Tax=Micromonospora qiuiae TaxID=502268 RepID=A0ABQ4J5Y1_9ACTN|nr:helix-turn-helix domain-containing protein [Micromonospora qiuiae]GIJ25458.1 transcriptional regulator [Micromonospora qiuiae]